MAHEPDSPQPDPSSDASKRPLSTWVVLAIAAVLLVAFAVTGLFGVAAWLMFAGVVVLLTAAYALILRRQTWARASDGKKRRQLVAVGGGLLVLGFVVAAMTVPPDQVQRTADDQSPSPSSASPSVSPSPTEEPLANQDCTVEADARSQGSIEYVCTPDDNGKLIWMDKESSEKLVEARKQAEEAQRQAEETRRQAEEAQRQAEEAAAAEEAQRRAEEVAAVEEAQRLAEEQARQQQQDPPPPGESFVYENCSAVQEAGAAPIRRGENGWQDGLDRDGDGVACAGD